MGKVPCPSGSEGRSEGAAGAPSERSYIPKLYRSQCASSPHPFPQGFNFHKSVLGDGDSEYLISSISSAFSKVPPACCVCCWWARWMGIGCVQTSTCQLLPQVMLGGSSTWAPRPQPCDRPACLPPYLPPQADESHVGALNFLERAVALLSGFETQEVSGIWARGPSGFCGGRDRFGCPTWPFRQAWGGVAGPIT